MLIGEPPFTGPTAQAIVARVMTEDPRGLTGQRKSIPPGVEAAIFTALEKLPADRYATAAEFAAALAGGATGRTAAHLSHTAPSRGHWKQIAIAAGVFAVAGVAFGVWAWRHQPPAPIVRLAVAFPAGEQIRSVSTRRFALSRDGSRIVYLGPDSASGNQLWVRELNSLTARPLPGTSGAQGPFFSPDGQSVGYLTGAPGDLRVVPIGGGPSVTVVRDSALQWGADWATDGSIYFSNATSQLARVPARGGRIEVLSHIDSASGVTEHDWPQALPGGKWALIQLWHSSMSDAELGLADLANGTTTPILQGLYGRYVPTGHIIYATYTGSLLRVPIDLSSGKLTGAPVAIAEQVQVDAVSGAAQFSVSDNGVLAYMTGGGTGSAQVVWVDRTGKQTAVDSTWRGQFATSALAPGDSRLAVTVFGAGEQVFIKRLPGGPVSRLSFVGVSNSRPTWVPGGRYLTFISALGGGTVRRQAWIQRADGSADAEPLATDHQGVEEVEWTPDGKRFLLRIGASNRARDIVIGTPGDSVRRPLVAGPADEFAPAVSPDGRWFAYVSNASGRNEIFVRLLDDPGAGRTQVSLNGGEEPRWAPSGKELYYRTRSGEIMAAEVSMGDVFTAKPPRVLFTAPNMATDNFHHAYAVARDGRFLMINQGASETGDVVMVFNWFEELKGRE
jgi:serine/threonine-protein kinase